MVCEAVRSQAQLMIQQVEAVEAAQRRRRRRPESSWLEGGGTSSVSPSPLRDAKFQSSTAVTPQLPSPSTPTIAIDACLSLADDLSTDSENEDEAEQRRRPEIPGLSSLSAASEDLSLYSRTPSSLVVSSPLFTEAGRSSGTAADSEIQRLHRALTECRQAVIDLQSSAQLKQQHLELQVLSWKQRYEKATQASSSSMLNVPQGMDATEEQNVAFVSPHEECERLREENYRWQALLLEACSTCHERRSLTSVKRQLWMADEEKEAAPDITNTFSSPPKASTSSRRLHRSAWQLLAQMEGRTGAMPCLRHSMSTASEHQDGLRKSDKASNSTSSPSRPVQTDLVPQQGRSSRFLRTSPASVSTRSSTTCSTSESFSIDDREVTQVVDFENHETESGLVGLEVLPRLGRKAIPEHSTHQF